MNTADLDHENQVVAFANSLEVSPDCEFYDDFLRFMVFCQIVSSDMHEIDAYNALPRFMRAATARLLPQNCDSKPEG